MRIIILCSLLFLASCTPGINTGKVSPSTSYQGTKPAVSLKQSSSTTVTNGMVATPTYGTGRSQVEIFADFQCPACILSNESIMPIFEEYAANGRLTITFRQFPLTMHKNAKWDAIAALCSAEQGGYMDYKKWLYTMEKVKSGKSVTDAERTGLAKTLGLDEAKFSTCLTSRTYEKQVESDIALGETKWVNGTPTIYLDGIKIDMSLFKDLDGFRSFLASRMK